MSVRKNPKKQTMPMKATALKTAAISTVSRDSVPLRYDYYWWGVHHLR